MKKDNLNNVIYLDQEGYDQYLAEIEQLRAKLNLNGQYKSDVYRSAIGDGWHDNFEFEDAKREEYKILCELRDKLEGLSRIVIIDKKEDSEVVDINDIIVILMSMNGKNPREKQVKLVASPNPDLYAEISEISVNSPLGKTIYQQEVGFKGNYSVNNNVIYVEICKILKNYEEVIEETNVLKRG